VEGILNCIQSASFLDNEGLCCNFSEKIKKKERKKERKPDLVFSYIRVTVRKQGRYIQDVFLLMRHT